MALRLPAPLRLRPLLLACLALLPLSAAAETRQTARFDLEIRGITVGQLRYSAVESGADYAVSGRLETTGFAALLRRMRYEASVRGRVSARGFAPVQYDQKGGSGKGYSEETVVWSGGLPRITREEPPRGPRSHAADPARQRGTVDSLTALYATLRDVPAGEECKASLVLFDGRYRMRLQMQAPERAADGSVRCTGSYIREQGFSPEEMAERTRFPFTLHYQPQSGGSLQVREVRMDSLYGSARLLRR